MEHAMPISRRAFLSAIPATAAAGELLAADEPKPGKLAAVAVDWPWWRGPTRDGIAAPDQKVPLEWSATKNVLWAAAVPGRGPGSDSVAEDRGFPAPQHARGGGFEKIRCPATDRGIQPRGGRRDAAQLNEQAAEVVLAAEVSRLRRTAIPVEGYPGVAGHLPALLEEPPNHVHGLGVSLTSGARVQP